MKSVLIKRRCCFEGFTLLELLIVIGIIGVLMALATVAYSAVQVGGRNARRKQDLVAVQNALEQYYSANSFQYPVGDCTLASNNLKSSWPVDPSSTNALPVQYLGVDTCAATTYCICAEMEGSSGNSGNSGLSSCNWQPDANGKYNYYCVSSLQ